jgi:hypothetical protein
VSPDRIEELELKLKQKGLSPGDIKYLLGLAPTVISKGHHPERIEIPKSDMGFLAQLQRDAYFPSTGTLPEGDFYHHVKTPQGWDGVIRYGLSSLFCSTGNLAGDGIYLASERRSKEVWHRESYGHSKLILQIDPLKPEEILYIREPREWIESQLKKYFEPTVVRTEEARRLAMQSIHIKLMSENIKAIVYGYSLSDGYAINMLIPHRLQIKGVFIDSKDRATFKIPNSQQETPVPPVFRGDAPLIPQQGQNSVGDFDTTKSLADCDRMNKALFEGDNQFGVQQFEELTGRKPPRITPFKQK